jgi:hypothetical protein
MASGRINDRQPGSPWLAIHGEIWSLQWDDERLLVAQLRVTFC